MRKRGKPRFLPVFVGENFVCIRGQRFFGDPYVIGKQVGYLLCKPAITFYRSAYYHRDVEEITLWKEATDLDWGNCRLDGSFDGIYCNLFKAGANETWDNFLKRQTRTIFVKKGK